MKKSLKPDLIIFGGSFDPPHEGHSDCIKFAKETFPKAKICVVPSFQTPLTKSEHKILHSSFEDRLAMCQRAFKDSVEFLSDIEKELNAPSYTVNLLNKIQQQFPKNHLAFLMGLDQLRNFSSWYKPEQILKIASLIVISRKSMEWQSIIEDFSKKFDVSNSHPLYKIIRETTPISSTQLREEIRNQKLSSSSMIHPEVLRYIMENHLYSS